MMPIGPMALIVLLILTAFGFLDGLLPRMRLTVRQALTLILLMLATSGLRISLTPGLVLGVGTGLVPLGVVAYLLLTADSWREALRILGAALVTGAAVYLVGLWFPPGQPTELNFFYLDAQYIFGLMAAVVGYGVGGNCRAAFSAAVLGVMLADVAHHMVNRWDGAPTTALIQVGGGGFWATGVVAGLLAVALVAVLGEFGDSLPETAAKPDCTESGGDEH